MIDDLKDIFGEKGFWIVIIVAVLLFVLMLFLGGNNSSGSEVVVTPTAYSSYPDAVTNANTIIDSVNAYTEYTGDRIIESTSGFIEDGLENLNKNLNENFDEIDASMNELGTGIADINSKLTAKSVTTRPSTTYQYSSRDDEDDSDRNRPFNGVVHSLGGKSSGSKSSGSKSSGKSYYNSTDYSGVSIVEGLASVGVTSNDGKNITDWQSRVSIAEANGIKNYTGTPEQNTEMLDKLKSGILVKPK